MALLTFLLAASTALACADHDYHGFLRKRAEPGQTAWAYEASYDWGRISPDYVLCQDGTQQAPIPLRLDQGLSSNHIPSFKGYDRNINGTFRNWGYGPAMNLAHNEGDYTSLPALTFEDNGRNETAYMTGWHIHAPADHSVQMDRSKAELHFVHVTPQGTPRAVLAFRLDPGSRTSDFFSALPPLISYRDGNKTTDASVNLNLALQEVDWFSEFWTYREGIRFFVARQIIFMNVEQMRSLLRVSHYSARSEQEVWLHQINV